MSDTISINGIRFPTELALTEEEQCRGLKFRKELPPAMSFLYPTPRFLKFWMSETPKPLDIVFANGGRINGIYVGEPFSTKLVGGDEPADLVIEFPYGTCKQFGFKPGDDITLSLTSEALQKFFSIKFGTTLFSGIKS